ncbi:uncharacterized protein ACIQIH_010276 isoform 1-T1 [Cyanocitta cristata]
MHKGGRTILRSLRRCLFSGPLTADTDTSYKEMEMKETVFELNIWSQPLSVTDSLKCFPYCWITEGQKTEIYEKIKEDATWAGVLYRLSSRLVTWKQGICVWAAVEMEDKKTCIKVVKWIRSCKGRVYAEKRSMHKWNLLVRMALNIHGNLQNSQM